MIGGFAPVSASYLATDLKCSEADIEVISST